MADVKITLSIKEHPDLFLSVTGGPGAEGYNFTRTALSTEKTGITWIMRDIPGSNAKLLVKDGAPVSGTVVTFREKGNYLALEPYQQGNIEQLVIFTRLDNSDCYVLNNHDETHVMDRSRRNEDKGWVIAYPWNGGDNQIWKLSTLS